MYICQVARRLGYPIESVHLGQNTKLTLITIVWKSQCPACLSNHVFSHYCQQSLSLPLRNSDRVQLFSPDASWSDEEEALIAEFQAILATTPRNALVVTIWRLHVF